MGFSIAEAYVDIMGNMNPLNSALSKAQSNTRTAVARMQRNFDRFARSAETASRRARLALLGYAAAMFGVGKAYADAEYAFARIKTLLRGQEKLFPILEKQGRELARTLKVRTAEAYDAMWQAISGGIEPLKAVEFAHAALQARIAGGVKDINGAAKALIAILNAYEAKGMRAAGTSDLFFQTIAKGITDFGELSQYIGQAASTMAKYQIPVEEFFGAIAAGTQVSLDTGRTITGLRSLVNMLSDHFGSARLASMGLLGALEELERETGGEMDALKKLLPELRGQAAAMDLMRQGFGPLIKSIKSMSGAADMNRYAFEQMDNTLTRKWEGLKSKAWALAEAIGQGLFSATGNARSMFDRLGDVMDRVRVATEGLFRQYGPLIQQITLFVGVGLAATAGLLPLVKVFGMVASLAKLAVGAISFLGSALAALFSPIGLIIGAMALVVAAITQATGKSIPELAAILVNALIPAFQSVVEWGRNLLNALMPVWTKIKEVWDANVKGIAETIIGTFIAIYDFMSVIVKAIGGAISAFVDYLSDNTNLIGGVLDWLLKAFQKCFEAIEFLFVNWREIIALSFIKMKGLFDKFIVDVTWLKDQVVAGFEYIGLNVWGFLKGLAGKLAAFVSFIGTFGKEMFNILKGIGSDIAKGPKHWAKLLAGTATSETTKAIRKAGDHIKNEWSKIGDVKIEGVTMDEVMEGKMGNKEWSAAMDKINEEQSFMENELAKSMAENWAKHKEKTAKVMEDLTDKAAPEIKMPDFLMSQKNDEKNAFDGITESTENATSAVANLGEAFEDMKGRLGMREATAGMAAYAAQIGRVGATIKAPKSPAVSVKSPTAPAMSRIASAPSSVGGVEQRSLTIQQAQLTELKGIRKELQRSGVSCFG